MDSPDPRNKSEFEGVRPGFAAVVFGVPAWIILFATVFGSWTLYGYVTGISWAGSLLALALRGFLNEEGDAFAPVENRATNIAPPLLTMFGVAALLESQQAPGVLLLALAMAWTFAAPWWRPYWKSRFVRALAMSEIAQAILVLVTLALLVWAWFSN